MVGLHAQAEADLRAFENLVLSWPLVREAYMLAGETDYILKCVAPDLTAFQDFVLNELTAAPNVASVKTGLAIRRAKRTLVLALTPNRRAAARRDPPPATSPYTRSRRSPEYARPMNHLRQR